MKNYSSSRFSVASAVSRSAVNSVSAYCAVSVCSGSAVAGVVAGVVTSVVIGVAHVPLRRLGSRSSARIRTVRPQVPPSLRWVRGLLPGDEGGVWLAEVASCLAETPDKSERRRFVRSYRRRMPQLIWTTWTVHLSGSRRRELS